MTVETRRRSVSKRTRFDVFKRDHFTCQYCGMQPPGVVLVVDHIMPVTKGGASTIDNLTTACEPCNQGKADKALEHVPIRPDADLLYLEAQQEIGEMRRYQEVMAERETVLLEMVETLQVLWFQVSGLNWSPPDRMVRQLLATYSLTTVEAAIRDVAAKVGGGYERTSGDKWPSYLFAVARNMEGGT